MSNLDNDEVEKLVRSAVKPDQSELRRDLWPEVISKLNAPPIRVPWFDWVLAAIVGIVCLLVPETAAGLFFHL